MVDPPSSGKESADWPVGRFCVHGRVPLKLRESGELHLDTDVAGRLRALDRGEMKVDWNMKLRQIINRACLSISRFHAPAPFRVGRSRRRYRWLAQCRLSWLLLLAGCAKAMVTPAWQPTGPLPRPDYVLVYDFAVTPDEVELDGGLGVNLIRLINETVPTEEKVRVGRALARVLAVNLATELRMRGIKARRAGDNALPDETVAFIKGQFLRIDEGSGALRTVVGFGLGGTEIQTHVQLFHEADGNTQLVAEADTATRPSLKPGAPPIIAAGWAAGSILYGAVGAGLTTLTSEEFYETVEADAKRTAGKLADWVADYYRQQGWLQP